MASVVRLKNSAKGEPYRIERRKKLSIEAANKQASVWWESGGTLAVVVRDDEGAEDARYARDYLDEDRVPSSWATARAAPSPVTGNDILDAILSKTETPREAPSVFNEEKPKPKPKKGAAYIDAAPGVCFACALPTTDAPFEGDDDPTPSGRLVAGRCADCGRPMPGLDYKQLLGVHLRARTG